jgi:hypothetical protein
MGGRRMKLVAASVFLLTVSVTALWAQDQLPVDIDHPVYRVIEMCSIRGIIPRVSAMKPYTRREVREYVRAAMEDAGSLTQGELSILESAYEEFREQSTAVAGAPASPRETRSARGGSQAPALGHPRPWDIHFREESDLRVGFSDAVSIHSVNAADVDVEGGLGPAFSFDLNGGVFFDKVDPQAFPPFEFTKKWDGFHIWFNDAGSIVSDGILQYPGFSVRSLPVLSLDIFDSMGNMQFSRIRREWGVGEGSLSLSATARPILAITGGIRPVSWANFSFLIGSLGNWWDPLRGNKMLSLHRLELFPFEWLYLSAWESVVWAKRMELTYLNPLMIYAIGQSITGDLDNIALGGDAALTISPYVRLYFSVFIDEIALFPLDQLFTRANNQFAWQAGAKAPVPWLPWSLLVVQYTKIEPYCYTHYPQILPQYTSPVDIGFSNDGENIGYHLPPNSDELLVRFSARLDAWELTAQYQLIRHGTGDHLLGQIEGDMDIPLIYDPPTTYPPKSFLNDGIYERLNVAKLRLSCTIRGIRTRAWAEYAFVSALNYENIAGNDLVMSLVGLGLRFNLK